MSIDYPSTGYEVINVFLANASEEELASIGLFPGDDADFLAEQKGTDVYTLENVMISSAYCLDDVKEAAATTLVTASATLLAVAFLN